MFHYFQKFDKNQMSRNISRRKRPDLRYNCKLIPDLVMYYTKFFTEQLLKEIHRRTKRITGDDQYQTSSMK